MFTQVHPSAVFKICNAKIIKHLLLKMPSLVNQNNLHHFILIILMTRLSWLAHDLF